jgi:glycosyltransferase involved in cell wall biosynthesis
VIQVLTQIPEAYFWLAGEGEQRTDLENFAKSIGVFDRVRFLGWHEDQADLYATADVCVLPSRYEPFGLVMIEAWAHKIPLVATRAAGPRATAQDMVDALLVPIDDIDAFGEAIRRILTDDILRASLVANGFNHYKQDYTVDSTVAQYHRLYQDILDQGPMIHRGLSRLGQIKDSILALFLS